MTKLGWENNFIGREDAREYVYEHLVVPHRYCNRCGTHVLESEIESYDYQCVFCDEDLYECETYTKENDIEEISDEDYIELVELVAELGIENLKVKPVEDYENEEMEL